MNTATADAVSAIGSDTGGTVLVGTAQGRILSCDTASGSLNAMNFDPALAVPGGQIYQFAFLGGGFAMARFGSALLRFDPNRNFWTAVAGNGLPPDEGLLQFIAVDSVRTPAMLYSATDYSVHASWDAGANWLPVGQGLPRRCHPSTLRFVSGADQQRNLCLFTYGRSAWTARLQ